ncbi:hypothetical protein FQR65_LT03140 [Abscondita terminalis]|nr:hypothetical protein FQR65_LT03140 [Abscondita terminalis]
MIRKRKPITQLSLDDDFTQQKRKKNVNGISQHNTKRTAGTLIRIVVKNFMCHSYLEVDFKHNINYIIGSNGSGKSAIMTALVVGLGGKASFTNRGNSVKSFVKAGKNTSSVEVTLNNDGPMAYRQADYGNEITIVRNFTATGSSSYKIKASSGAVISTLSKEIQRICNNFNIQIDNPICLLNQDTSRNFLNTKDPRQKFLLFMKATRLETLCAEYKKALGNKKDAVRMLKEKEISYDKLKKELQLLKKKMEDQKSIQPLREKTLNLQCEIQWAKVGRAELDQAAQERAVDRLKQELSALEAEMQTEASEYAGYDDAIRTARLQIAELQMSIEQQNEPQSALVRVLGDLKESLCTKRREKNAASKDIALKMGNSKILEDEINNITKNFEQLEAEKLKRVQDIQDIEVKIRDVEALLKTSQNDLYQHRNAVERIQDEQLNLAAEIRQIDSQIESTNAQLNELKENTNVMSLYGRDVPRIIEAIQKEKNKFTHLPRGPLGSYLTLKDKKWVVAVEGFLSPSLLRAFAVDNRKDNELLLRIFEKICRPDQKPMVIISKFFFQTHDVSPHLVRPVNGCISVFDSLEISDPVVTNCLIDQVRLESVLLIPDNQTAIKLMSNKRDVPRNCRQGITVKGDRYYPDPNYKTYASRYRNAQYLQVSMADRISQLEQKLSSLQDKRENVCSKHESVNADFQVQIDYAKGLEIKVVKLTRGLLRLKRDLSDLQNVDEPADENLTKMKEELRELGVLIQQKTESQTHILNDMKELERKIAAKEEKLERIKNIIRGYEDRIQPLNVEINEKQARLQNYEVNKRFGYSRIADCKKRLSSANADLNEKLQRVLEKTRDANGCGARPTELREVNVIANELNENQRLITQLESNMESLEVIMCKYVRCKNQNREVTEFMNTITEDIKLLQTVLEKCNHHYKHTQDYFISFIKYSFEQVLQIRQFNVMYSFILLLIYSGINYFVLQGHLEIDMEEKKLDIVVIPQHGSEKITTTANLSGGERSFSTVAFLYSLWQCVEFPFYFLDEFDVFMDTVNRSKVMEILLFHAKKCPDLQFVFLTPQDISFLSDESVAIHRLADPERSQPA